MRPNPLETALKPDVEPLVLDRPEDVRNPVILLHQPGGQTALICDDPQQVFEVAVFMDERHPRSTRLGAERQRAQMPLVPVYRGIRTP